MKAIAEGAAKHARTKWFPELSDKCKKWFVFYQTPLIGKSTKTHLYYCMKNSDGCPDTLQSSIDNIVQHYQEESPLRKLIVIYNTCALLRVTISTVHQILTAGIHVRFDIY